MSYQHLQTSTCSCSAPIRPCPDDDDLILGGAEEIIGDHQCQSTNATSEFQHLRADLPLARPRCRRSRPRKEPRGHPAYSKSSTSYNVFPGLGNRIPTNGYQPDSKIARLSSVQSRPGGCLGSVFCGATHPFVQRKIPRFRPISTSPDEKKKQASVRRIITSAQKNNLLPPYRASPTHHLNLRLAASQALFTSRRPNQSLPPHL